MGHSPKKICLVTPGYPPRDWGGLARTAAPAGRPPPLPGPGGPGGRTPDRGHGAGPFGREPGDPWWWTGWSLHRIKAGREFFGGRNRTIWDCPHTYTLRMWHQSLTLLQERERYDLFCAFFLYPMGYLTTMLARSTGCPRWWGSWATTSRSISSPPEKVGMCRAGLEGASLIVSLSREMADMAQALTPVRNKTRLVYGSVALPGKVMAWPGDRRAALPVRLCRIVQVRQGLPYLFKALGELNRRTGVELELAGEVRESEQNVYETMKERAGVEGLVRFKGTIPHREMADWLLSLDGFVLPSVSEGCPNILLEAMACGLPCVSTRVGATPVIMEDKVSGLLVPAGDSRALARGHGSPDRPARQGGGPGRGGPGEDPGVFLPGKGETGLGGRLPGTDRFLRRGEVRAGMESVSCSYPGGLYFIWN